MFAASKNPEPLSIRAADADAEAEFAVYEDDCSPLLGSGGSMGINADEPEAVRAVRAAPLKQRKPRSFWTQFNTFLRREVRGPPHSPL